MPEIAGLDKKQWIYVAVGGGALGLWYLHKKSTAAATGTATTDTGTDSGSVDTGPTGGAADAGYPYGGFGDSSGGSYSVPGNYGGLPPVTGNSAGTTAPSPSTRTITVRKGETQKEIIEAAGETYQQFTQDNPSLAAKGSKVKTGQKVTVR